MEQIYRFDEMNPPVLNEAKLKKIQAEKEKKRNIILVCLASILSALCIVLAIPVLAPESIMLALIFEPERFLPVVILGAYAVMSFASICIVSVVFCYNRRVFI